MALPHHSIHAIDISCEETNRFCEVRNHNTSTIFRLARHSQINFAFPPSDIVTRHPKESLLII
jgi:hypothetical protein